MTASPETLRLFVAIELPPHTREALAATIELLRRELRGPFRWVAPESLHLTLKFLGNVERARVEMLASTLKATAAKKPPFSLCLDGAGTFPQRGSPKVLWTSIGGEANHLMALQSSVETSLVEAGEAPQDNPFRPHLTIARAREPLPRHASDAVRERLEQLRFPGQAEFLVERIGLIHSTLTPKGPIYRRLAEASLGA